MGNVYMEADQVRFKDSTYRNVQEGLAAALEGGGGGGTTVVANPEGSATADLAKLQVGTTIYGIPAEAGDISYDNTSSGLTADDVQEAIDEVATDLGSLTTIIGDSSAGLVKEVTDIQDLIPSGATSENKLATESDIPDENNYNSVLDIKIGEWAGQPLYRYMSAALGALPNATQKSIYISKTGITIRKIEALATNSSGVSRQLPILGWDSANNKAMFAHIAVVLGSNNTTITAVTNSDYSGYNVVVSVEYTIDSEAPTS